LESRNISSHKTAGIGSWTDAEIKRALHSIGGIVRTQATMASTSPSVHLAVIDMPRHRQLERTAVAADAVDATLKIG
jgi:hypothetical protein